MFTTSYARFLNVSKKFFTKFSSRIAMFMDVTQLIDTAKGRFQPL